MENFKKIKEDLVGMLITLGENSLSDKEKIKECDKLILDTIKSIDLIINLEEKKELYEDIAYDLLMKKHYAAGVTNQEYRDGDVWFEFHIYSHDYSAGRDSDVISKSEIEKELLLRTKRSNKV